MTGFSSATMAKGSSGKPVNAMAISRICTALQCQPPDIMKYESDPKGRPSKKTTSRRGDYELPIDKTILFAKID